MEPSKRSTAASGSSISGGKLETWPIHASTCVSAGQASIAGAKSIWSAGNRDWFPRSRDRSHTPLERRTVAEKVLHQRQTYHLGPMADRLVPGPVSRYRDLGCWRLSHSQAKWHRPTARQGPSSGGSSKPGMRRGPRGTSPCCFRARDHRGLDGDKKGRRRSTTHRF